MHREGEKGMGDLFEWQWRKWQRVEGWYNAIRQRGKGGHGCKVNEKNGGHETRQDVSRGPRDRQADTVDNVALKWNHNMETTPTHNFSVKALWCFLVSDFNLCDWLIRIC